MNAVYLSKFLHGTGNHSKSCKKLGDYFVCHFTRLNLTNMQEE